MVCDRRTEKKNCVACFGPYIAGPNTPDEVYWHLCIHDSCSGVGVYFPPGDTMLQVMCMAAALSASSRQVGYPGGHIHTA